MTCPTCRAPDDDATYHCYPPAWDPTRRRGCRVLICRCGTTYDRPNRPEKRV